MPNPTILQTERVRMGDGAELATWTRRPRTTEPGNPAIFLLHGGPGLWDYLGPVDELLDGAGVVHRYDQRGCGRSSPSDDLSVERYINDLEELRQHWAHERIVVIGHSFGATLALAYAGTYPERVMAVGYVSGVGIGDWHRPYRAEVARRRKAFGLADRLQELSERSRTPEEEIAWRQLKWATDYADTTAGLEHARVMAEMPLTINHDANRRIQISDADVISWAARVTCPVYFLHGAADPRPARSVMTLSSKTPRPRRRAIQGAGHLPWVESPNEVGNLLREIVFSAV